MFPQEKILCPLCNREITKINFEKHQERHKNHPERINMIHLNHEGVICQYCSKECKNRNSLAQHEIRCKNNPNALPKSSNYKNGMLGKTNKRKGLTEENCYEIRKAKETYQKNKQLGLHKDTSGENNNMRKFPELKAKISKTCLEKSAKGEWHTSLCKNHHHKYKGVDLHCKWELEYAKWLDINNIKWIRPKEKFKYFYKEKIHYYTPDFYLTETQEYIEIKGYATEKDYAKWKNFPKDKKLTILRKKDLLNLKINIK